MRPMRRPSTPSCSVGGDRRRGQRDRRRVGRVVAADDLDDEGGVGDGRRERADLVEAAGEGDEPVAADDAVRRLDPDDAAQGGRLADRPAGVAAEADGGEPGGDGRRRCRRSTRRAPGSGRAGCASGRTPSSRCSSPSRTRRGWSCRRAPRRRRARRCDDGRVVRRPPALEDLRRARRRDAARAHVVLEGDRHAGERPGIAAGGDGGVDRRGRRAGLVGEHER